MSQHEYGVCAYCGRGRALRKAGTVRVHRLLNKSGYTLGQCPGSDHPPIARLPGRPKHFVQVLVHVKGPAMEQQPSEREPIEDPTKVITEGLAELGPLLVNLAAGIQASMERVAVACERIATTVATMDRKTTMRSGGSGR